MIRSFMARLHAMGLGFELAFTSKDIPVCETRIVKKQGAPWSGRIAVHPRSDRVELTDLDQAMPNEEVH